MDANTTTALVERLLGDTFESELTAKLRELGESALQALLAALHDVRFHDHPYKTSHAFDAPSVERSIKSGKTICKSG
jgi:hypothetical protein